MTSRDPAANEDGMVDRESEALNLMERALAILDETDVPADTGACLDLAIQRLREWMARRG